jgi:hypothetical protein
MAQSPPARQLSTCPADKQGRNGLGNVAIGMQLCALPLCVTDFCNTRFTEAAISILNREMHSEASF